MVISAMPLGSKTGHEVGRILLSQLYESYVGGPMPEILTTERGKPYFANGPYFSIAHTKKMAFCVLFHRPVGIDAEPKDRDIDLRLADKILSPSEKAQFDSAEDKRLALLKFWVLKEATAKCTGEGLKGYPNHTEFSLDDPRIKDTSGHIVVVVKAPKEEQE